MNTLISAALVFYTLLIRMTLQTNTGCLERSLVGNNKLNIPDSSFTASSYLRQVEDYTKYVPAKAKLLGPYGWAAETLYDSTDWLQIDLGVERVIFAVATQGNGGEYGGQTPVDSSSNEWVTWYKLQFSVSGSVWTMYNEHRNQTEIKGNTDCNTVVRMVLKNQQWARYIRFTPVRFKKWKTMRVDVSVVKIQEAPTIWGAPEQRSILLNWRVSSCLRINITGFTVNVRDETLLIENHDVMSNERNYTVNNLTPYTEYSVRVKVNTGVGPGSRSSTEKITTTIAEPKAIVTIVKIESNSSTTATIQWKLEEPHLVYGPLLGYQIKYTAKGEATKTKDVGQVTQYTLTSLEKYTLYNITVSVRNTKYISPPSRAYLVSTKEDGETDDDSC